MAFPLSPARLSPMEARIAEALPEGRGWQFEPKWDGFRCLAYKDGDRAVLMAKSGKKLTDFFPEVTAALKALPAARFVADGELVIPVGDKLSFDALQMRLHPAESRRRKLAAETPALLVLSISWPITARILPPRYCRIGARRWKNCLPLLQTIRFSVCRLTRASAPLL